MFRNLRNFLPHVGKSNGNTDLELRLTRAFCLDLTVAFILAMTGFGMSHDAYLKERVEVAQATLYLQKTVSSAEDAVAHAKAAVIQAEIGAVWTALMVGSLGACQKTSIEVKKESEHYAALLQDELWHCLQK